MRTSPSFVRTRTTSSADTESMTPRTGSPSMRRIVTSWAPRGATNARTIQIDRMNHPAKHAAEETPLLERVLDILTPNQGRILGYLWNRKSASYDTLTSIPKAWRDVPSHDAITKQLKAIRTKLDANNLSVVHMVISTAKCRVTLERPD